jgi:glycosyltransferase involved in cell wall biosynthesis
VGEVPTPHVVMVVANDIATDTRVKKEALALARSGLRVTLVGAASERQPNSSWMGSVEIVRVPVDFAVRDEAIRNRRFPRRHLLFDLNTEARAKRRIGALERDVCGRSHLAFQGQSESLLGTPLYKAGVAERKLELRLLRGGRLVARLQGGLARRVERRKLARQGPVRWRAQHPRVLDYEVAFGPVIDALTPDVLHAHDMHIVGIAAHASARARAAGRDLPWVYDAHEYVPGLSEYGGRTARDIQAWADLENEFIRDAARVITVSPAIADILQERYQLAVRPTVVLNIPTVDAPGSAPVRALREVCGLAPDVPLLTYSGGTTEARGLHTAIEAIAELPQAHLGLVCVPHTDTADVLVLRRQASDMGLSDRVHFVNPVSSGQVVDFLRGVDVALIPALSYPSHEMSLPNKLFEYLHAGLPIVSSDLRSISAFLRESGAGLTHPVEDASGLAAAVRAVLADRESYATAAADPALLARYSWTGQADQLRAVYDELLGTHLVAARTERIANDEVVDLTETDRPAG